MNRFIETYFNQNEKLAFEWLSDLLDFIFRNEENREMGSRFKLIPTQDGQFRVYSEFIYREINPSEFADRIKPMFKNFTGKGDPESFLVHKSLKNENIRGADLTLLTRAIDDLFNLRDAEDMVKEGQKYHSLFLQLKEWVEERPNADEYFPIFCKKQPILYIKAFGEGSSLGRLLRLKKTVEEIENLDKLSLTPDQMKQLDEAALGIGDVQSLIEKAREMAQQADEIRWRQAVGKIAEDAFIEALAEADPAFPKPDNPDDGKDFVIRANGKEYSIEIKSAIENKETVKMSLKQGETANSERGHYALCVISRPSKQHTDKVQFIEKAKFVIDIGDQIGDKIVKWRTGLSNLDAEDDVSIQLDNKTGFVNVKKSTWNKGISFNQFVAVLQAYFGLVSS